jgi:small subunit ribosomal protein S1
MKEKAENLTWDPNITKLGIDYSEEERKELKKLYEDTLKPVAESEVVKGTVVGINDRDIIVNIGVKSDGLIPISEFRDTPDIKLWDEVDVYVEEQENNKGQLVLSRKKAKLMKVWEVIQESAENGAILEALVKRRTKGGLIVDLQGVEAFLPGSQIDVKPIRDFDIFLDKTIDVTVIKINHLTDNVIVSHKAVIEKSLENQKTNILSKLEKGQILEGIVKNMTTFGVFVGLGGIDGLLHITDISWRRINHPEEVLELGQKIRVVVTDFDEERKRISLGMKQLTPNPWGELPEHIQIGAKVKGKIVNIADYGAFLEIMPGIEGLIHISEMSWSQHLKKVDEVVHIGDEIEAIVLSLDKEEKKMSLGIKQLTQDPWAKEGLEEKYAPGIKHTGTIKNITHFGALVELEEGIDGLLHISDLSWTKKVNHPTDMLKLGDKIEILILEFDKENRRLSLGLKQLDENPWETYETIFQVGSTHMGTITKKTDKGAFIELAYGLEGFVPKRHLVKENGQEAAMDEQLEFEIIEFSKLNKRIVLAHTGSLKTAKPTAKKEFQPRSTGNFITSEKATLGDLEVLATLKKQLDAQKEAKKVNISEQQQKHEEGEKDQKAEL